MEFEVAIVVNAPSGGTLDESTQLNLYFVMISSFLYSGQLLEYKQFLFFRLMRCKHWHELDSFAA